MKNKHARRAAGTCDRQAIQEPNARAFSQNREHGHHCVTAISVFGRGRADGARRPGFADPRDEVPGGSRFGFAQAGASGRANEDLDLVPARVDERARARAGVPGQQVRGAREACVRLA